MPNPAHDLLMLAIGGLLYGALTTVTGREWISALVVVLALVAALVLSVVR